ncbi:hypothetical protein E1B28_013020 [Marasmius oreades]|uniref:Uncharacterized protein n=1 Tax=Marasmius oreades TaxID=181124 RepID=A0A9P7RNT1_9AGAR|nr:uncharacterized protein E1B28_013020 [Marasmius oreades]KAG7087041.1 hypothetical protein E1B28_013020 [Marasmius oreades]
MVTSTLRPGFLLISANILADILLIHRCYLVWGSSKPLLIILGFLAAATNTLGLITVIMLLSSSGSRKIYEMAADIKLGYNGAAAGVNLLITLLTAARIWWTTREARTLMGGHITRFYRRIVTIILESGITYPLFLAANVALFSNQETIVLVVDLQPTAVLIAGIAPALSIVQAHYGKKSAGDWESMAAGARISDIQFPDLSRVSQAEGDHVYGQVEVSERNRNTESSSSSVV